MKSFRTWLTLTLLIGTGTAYAGSDDSEVKRLHDAAEVVGTMHELNNGEELSSDIWQQAQCVVVIPEMKKVGLLFGGEFGKGVASCRDASGWSAPAFFKLQRGTFGFQAGAEKIDLVLLVMDHEGLGRLLEDKVSLGATASAAAGQSGRAASAGTSGKMSGGILSYSRASGLFAGVDVSGGVLMPDEDANEDFYGRDLTTRQILIEHAVTPPPAAITFLDALRAEFPAGSTEQ